MNIEDRAKIAARLDAEYEMAQRHPSGLNGDHYQRSTEMLAGEQSRIARMRHILEGLDEEISDQDGDVFSRGFTDNILAPNYDFVITNGIIDIPYNLKEMIEAEDIAYEIAALLNDAYRAGRESTRK